MNGMNLLVIAFILAAAGLAIWHAVRGIALYIAISVILLCVVEAIHSLGGIAR